MGQKEGGRGLSPSTLSFMNCFIFFLELNLGDLDGFQFEFQGIL